MLPVDMLHIDDSNFQEHIEAPDGMSKGYVPRDYAAEPFGSLPYASPFSIPLIPESEHADRIRIKNETKSSLVHLYLNAVETQGFKCKDQNGTNYCWCNAPTMCVELLRLAQGQPYVPLSPASVGGPIKGYRNVGGWGGEALKYIVEHGVAAASIWPPNGISRQYNTEEAKANALQHRVTEWWELENRNLAQLKTCVLLNIPVAIGLNWWGHEVTAVALDTDGIWILNSWAMTFGNKGLAKLSFAKATPDDAVAPCSTIPSMI